jgi:glycine cleavage system H lipoate-binding protein
MNAILDFLQSAGIFLAGLTIRLAFFLGVLAAVLIPVLAVFYAVQGIKALRRKSEGMEVIDGVRILPRRIYAPGHLWLGRRFLGGLRVGLDDLAQRLFPNLSAVELPKPGRLLRRGEPAIYLRSNGREAWLPAPMTGLVVAVNRAAERMPGLVNSSPYGRGWFYAMRPATASYRQFPTGPAARAWFRAEEDRLRITLEHELSFAAADGGRLMEHPATLLPKDRWEHVVTSFLGGITRKEADAGPEEKPAPES